MTRCCHCCRYQVLDIDGYRCRSKFALVMNSNYYRVSDAVAAEMIAYWVERGSRLNRCRGWIEREDSSEIGFDLQ